MLILLVKALFLGFLLYLMYFKGFTDCMFGNNDELYDKLREWYITKYGEDIWNDDNSSD